MRIYKIADNEVTVQKNSLSINDKLNQRTTASFTVVEPGFDITKGMDVTIGQDGQTIFAGKVHKPRESGDKTRYVSVSCVDFSQMIDKRVIAEVYEDALAGDIVKDFIAKVFSQEGISEGTIQDGPVMSKAVFPYINGNAAMNELCDQTGYFWEVDKDKKLNFFERATYNAPFELTDNSGNYSGLQVEEAADNYRNRQITRGPQAISTVQTREFEGDGKRQVFSVDLPIAKVPTVKVNGATKTVGIRGVETGKDFYWQKDDKTISQETVQSAWLEFDGADNYVFFNISNIKRIEIEMTKLSESYAEYIVDFRPDTNAYLWGGSSTGDLTAYIDGAQINNTRDVPLNQQVTVELILTTPSSGTMYLMNRYTLDRLLKAIVHGVSMYDDNDILVNQYKFDEGTGSTVGDSIGDSDGTIYGATWATQGVPLTTSDTLTIEYQGYYPIIIVAENPGEIEARKTIEGGSGIYENVAYESNLDTQESSLQYTEGLLEKYGFIPDIVTFNTYNHGLKAGQLIPIQNTKHGLTGTYLIESVTCRDDDGLTLYTIKCLDGASVGGWERFYMELIKSSKKMVIRENEILVSLTTFRDGFPVPKMEDEMTYTLHQYHICGQIICGTDVII